PGVAVDLRQLAQRVLVRGVVHLHADMPLVVHALRFALGDQLAALVKGAQVEGSRGDELLDQRQHPRVEADEVHLGLHGKRVQEAQPVLQVAHLGRATLCLVFSHPIRSSSAALRGDSPIEGSFCYDRTKCAREQGSGGDPCWRWQPWGGDLLTLRQEQTDLFARHELERFEARVIAHLRQYFPQRMASVSEQNARGLVRFCMERARRYGIVTERSLVLYISVAVALGSRFDQRHAWA